MTAIKIVTGRSGSLRNAATLQLRTVNGNTFNVAVRPG
jgi:hypothetical protein